jgi:transposase, IS30 family
MAMRVLSYETRLEFFERVCGGASIVAAVTAVGVARGTGQAWWRTSAPMELVVQQGRFGGLPGPVPVRAMAAGGEESEEPPRQRRALTGEDRAAIAVGLRCGATYAQIGAMIGRDKSVVWREVGRNRGPDGTYWAPLAHRAAHERRKRPKQLKLIANPGLCRRIASWMDDGWSPKLIATVLKHDHPHTIMDRVNHETIYQALYVQTRGQLRADLNQKLSLKRRQRKPRGSSDGRGKSLYTEAFTIRDRPAEAADRAVPGHWEGDLIMGAGNTSAVGTLVERSTRFTILLHLPGRHDATSVAEAMIGQMSRLPEHLRRSITWDRGSELAEFEKIQLELGTPVYFCDPRSPWQRGSNENTNRLLRFWLEKGTDLSQHSATDLDRIAATLNARPRPTLDLQTPAQALAALLSNPAAA